MTKTRTTADSEPGRQAAQGDKTWQQTKSEMTRTAILDAALQCFYRLGYNNTTTEKIAAEAGVSRGAMLHHFPSRIALIASAVKHLNEKRLSAYEQEETAVQDQARFTRIEEGIESYWRQLDSWLFVVFLELQVAARTDPELHAIMVPAVAEFDSASREATRKLFPDLALSEQFNLAVSVSLYLLEGLAVNKITRESIPLRDMVMEYLKGQLRTMFRDVHEVVDRESASSGIGRRP
ncbi:MAG: TetR/AcrR family transcriptional regulator [Gammaproteobacteria bacterium]|nr:TetR/AcrR family transcriptional regulator [Gammaproteobacteria bacterium]